MAFLSLFVVLALTHFAKAIYVMTYEAGSNCDPSKLLSMGNLPDVIYANSGILYGSTHLYWNGKAFPALKAACNSTNTIIYCRNNGCDNPAQEKVKGKKKKNSVDAVKKTTGSTAYCVSVPEFNQYALYCCGDGPCQQVCGD